MEHAVSNRLRISGKRPSRQSGVPGHISGGVLACYSMLCGIDLDWVAFWPAGAKAVSEPVSRRGDVRRPEGPKDPL
jgi:hypothetical protein